MVNWKFFRINHITLQLKHFLFTGFLCQDHLLKVVMPVNESRD